MDESGRRIYVTLKYGTGDNRSTHPVQGVLIWRYSLADEGERLNLQGGARDDQNRWIASYLTLQRGTISN